MALHKLIANQSNQVKTSRKIMRCLGYFFKYYSGDKVVEIAYVLNFCKIRTLLFFEYFFYPKSFSFLF